MFALTTASPLCSIHTHTHTHKKKKKISYILCYSWISNLSPVFKPVNQIMSWLPRFKKGPAYVKSKNRSMSQRAQSKSGPTHALDGLLPHVCGQQSFTCANKSYWKEAAKHNLGTRLVSSISC